MIKVEHKKSLVKPLSLNFDKTLMGKGYRRFYQPFFRNIPIKKEKQSTDYFSYRLTLSRLKNKIKKTIETIGILTQNLCGLNSYFKYTIITGMQL